MIQRHKVLINKGFSASTEVPESSLVVFGNYQVNGPPGLGGGIVNPSTVRFFLNDDVNDYIINDFFSYLTGSTNTQEFSEIFHSDQKLSDVFNDYYVTSVLGNQVPTTSVIDTSLVGTFDVEIIRKDIFNYNGYQPYGGLDNIPQSINNSSRKEHTYNALDTFTEEESYYVPVFITMTNKLTPMINMQSCEEKSSLIINNGEFTFNGSADKFVGDITDVRAPIRGFEPIQDIEFYLGEIDVGKFKILKQ